MATNTLWAQSEVVRKKAFPVWQTKAFSLALDLVKRGEVEEIGERDFRIPYELTTGGRIGKYDPQMGDMGRGSSGTGGYMVGSYLPLKLAFEMDFLKIKANKDGTSKIKPFAKTVSKAFEELTIYRDKLFHGTGTATLGQATATATVSSKTQYTLDANTGCNHLRRGLYVDVYDTTLATLRASGVAIEFMDITARTANLAQLVTGAAATDKLVLEGGTPSTGYRGLYYWQSDATSGTTAGVNRAVEPEIRTNSVNAAGGLTPEHAIALYHRVLQRRGKAADGLLGLLPVAQQAHIVSQVMSIQRVDISRGTPENVDRMPSIKGKKTIMWGDMPHNVDIHQNQSRIDYIKPDTWGRARLEDEKFFEIPGERKRFFTLYGGSGAPAAGVWFALTVDEDFYCTDPGANGYIYGLTLPTLYQ